jgi:hypothetical protein
MKPIFVTALICLSVSCSNRSLPQQVVIENFAMTVPQGVRITKQHSMEDFTTYECRIAGQPILNFYVGNAPSFPHEQNSSQRESDSIINGMKARTLRDHSKGNQRETLVEISDNGWPRFVHFWYEGLQDTQSDTADAIINSVRVRQ